MDRVGSGRPGGTAVQPAAGGGGKPRQPLLCQGGGTGAPGDDEGVGRDAPDRQGDSAGVIGSMNRCLERRSIALRLSDGEGTRQPEPLEAIRVGGEFSPVSILATASSTSPAQDRERTDRRFQRNRCGLVPPRCRRPGWRATRAVDQTAERLIGGGQAGRAVGEAVEG